MKKHNAFAEISLDNLLFNFNSIKEKVKESNIIPVIKADAYGHGAVKIAKALEKEDVKLFAVAQFKEAMELRESGVLTPILILGRLFPNEIKTAVKNNFRLTLYSKEDIEFIEKAHLEKKALVHAKIDTGMGRLGVLLDNEPDFFDKLTNSKFCLFEGIYSHFSTSDEEDKTYANIQLKKFKKILSDLKEKKTLPKIIHMANSGAILSIEESYFNAVRPGLILYGYYPSYEVSKSIKLKQVMTLKTFVAHIRKIPKGMPVSYGRRWISDKDTKIAVLPIGYADGIKRSMSNKCECLIKGKLYPIVGTVTMDYIMIDVGYDNINLHDEAIIWGKDISLLDIAEKINTIPYVLTCGVSKRVKRVIV
jgi:alanine racemase